MAFLSRLSASQAMFNVPVLIALLGSLCVKLALSQVELEYGFHHITSSGGIHSSSHPPPQCMDSVLPWVCSGCYLPSRRE